MTSVPTHTLISEDNSFKIKRVPKTTLGIQHHAAEVRTGANQGGDLLFLAHRFLHVARGSFYTLHRQIRGHDPCLKPIIFTKRTVIHQLRPI